MSGAQKSERNFPDFKEEESGKKQNKTHNKEWEPGKYACVWDLRHARSTSEFPDRPQVTEALRRCG